MSKITQTRHMLASMQQTRRDNPAAAVWLDPMILAAEREIEDYRAAQSERPWLGAAQRALGWVVIVLVFGTIGALIALGV